MPDVIQNWLTSVREESQAQWDQIADQDLDDTFGWGAMLKTLLSRMGSRGSSPKERSRYSGGILLTGPAGCGKHTAAAHMMTQLFSRAYEMLFLSGSSFAQMGAQKSIECLEFLLDDCISKEQALCIQLEELEDCPCRRELLSYFGQQLRNYDLSAYPPLFLILIDGREQEIPASLRSRLMLCRMSLPSLEKRTAFLEHYARDLRNTLSLSLFARHTEGASYAQLLDMVTALNWLVDSQDLEGLPDGALLEFLAGQMPEQPRETRLDQLIQSAQELIRQMPELLKHISIPVVGAQTGAMLPSKPPEKVDDAAFVSNKRREIEDMDVRQLAGELFGGEEGVRQMLQQIEANRQ